MVIPWPAGREDGWKRFERFRAPFSILQMVVITAVPPVLEIGCMGVADGDFAPISVRTERNPRGFTTLDSLLESAAYSEYRLWPEVNRTAYLSPAPVRFPHRRETAITPPTSAPTVTPKRRRLHRWMRMDALSGARARNAPTRSRPSLRISALSWEGTVTPRVAAKASAMSSGANSPRASS